MGNNRSLPKMKLFTLIACIRAQIPEQLKFIQLFDEGGSPDFFVSNTVDESCIRSRSSQCYDDCHYITDKSDYYSELKCRFCLIRWKCFDQKKLRQCGKAKCHKSCDNEQQGAKLHYGVLSVWRQEECLSCLLKEQCATEYDLKLHYGFTRNCVGECVARQGDVCPSLPVADRCAQTCHQRCTGQPTSSECFTTCLAESMCKGMTVDCIDCIETCAAAKTVVEEANDRSLFDVPQLKAHFTTTFIEEHDLVDPNVPETGRFREEKESKKKQGEKKKKRKERRKDKKVGSNGKKMGSKRQQKYNRKQSSQ